MVIPFESIEDTRAIGRGVMAEIIILYTLPLSSDAGSTSRNGPSGAKSLLAGCGG